MKEKVAQEEIKISKLDIFKSINKETDISQIVSNLDTGIKEFLKSDGFKKYLNYMTSFYTYSFNNIFLISMQRDNATHVGSFTFWKSKNRHVKKGEQGIRILAPTTSKREVEIKLLNEKNEPLKNNDGSIQTIKENRTVITGFKWTTVFDVSQTDGEPLPKIINKLNKNTPISSIIKDIITTISTCPIKYQDISANGYFDLKTNEIVIKSGMSNDQTAKTLVHEFAHSLVHKGITDYTQERPYYEMQAEGIAYVVLKRYGLDTSDYSFGYVTSWIQNMDDNKYKDALTIIQKESSSIINKIDAVIEKEIELINNTREKEIIKELKKEHITPKKSLVDDIMKLEDRILEKVNIHKLCEGKLRIPNEEMALHKISSQLLQQGIEM